jgi:hypothetical protein
MWTIRFEAFGDLSVSELVQAAAPAIDESTARARIMAASISPSDMRDVDSSLKRTNLLRIPKRDFALELRSGAAAPTRVLPLPCGVTDCAAGKSAPEAAVPAFDQAARVGVNFMVARRGIDASGLKGRPLC